MADINIHNSSEIKAFIKHYKRSKECDEFWTLKMKNDTDEVIFYFNDVTQLESSMENVATVLFEYNQVKFNKQI